MTDHLNVEVVDQDGAIREALDASVSSSRSDWLRRAVTGGGMLLVGGVAIKGLPLLTAGAAPSKSGDAAILNFALTLEYLESAFYAEAVKKGALSGATATFAKTVAAHEAAHVAFLKKALGSSAGKKPKFDFMGTTADQGMFQATAVALEDTGVAAYNGAGSEADQGDPGSRGHDRLGRGPPRRLDQGHHRQAARTRRLRRTEDQEPGSDRRHRNRIHPVRGLNTNDS